MHQTNHHLLDRDCQNPHPPLQRRTERYHSALHLCVFHENLLGQIVKSSMYNVHACTYNTCTVSYHVYTWYIRVRTMCINVHTVYMGSTYGMHMPLLYMPLCTLMNSTCDMYVPCYSTGFSHSVQAVFRQGYTCQEWCWQVGSFPVAFSHFRV